MIPSARLAQLYALRAQVEALILAEEAEVKVDESACIHPEDKRRDTTTAGGPRKFLCLQCDREIQGVA